MFPIGFKKFLLTLKINKVLFYSFIFHITRFGKSWEVTKAVVEGRTSVEGGAPGPKKTIEFPKIVYTVLTPCSTSLVPSAAPTSPTCGLEELLRQAEILQV